MQLTLLGLADSFGLADQVASGRLVPSLWGAIPFAALLLSIAILPLLRPTQRWWERDTSRLIVSLGLATLTLLYYYTRPFGIPEHRLSPAPAAAVVGAETVVEGALIQPGEVGTSVKSTTAQSMALVGQAGSVAGDPPRTDPGVETVAAVLQHALLDEYLPFIVLLFSLYSISGGLVVRGAIAPTPINNMAILGVGGLLASFIGTTGAAMVLIRPLLRINQRRRHTIQTPVFFIFIVANSGGLLLPVGDPPLFLGYLKGVSFFWTLTLMPQWAFVLATLLLIYYIIDVVEYRHEPLEAQEFDASSYRPIRLAGWRNLGLLLGVMVAVVMLDPGKPVPGTGWTPPVYLREAVQLGLTAISFLVTPRGLRGENGFNFAAIIEVAIFFVGIFITMQVPIEILNVRGTELGLTTPLQFFLVTGLLSSFLDNAPTYVVFFETARALHGTGFDGSVIEPTLLAATSCGAVFMGANSYIGNGPNFMVKSIAEQSGVKMPSFFGYMGYALAVLGPIWLVTTLIFFSDWA